LPYAGRVRAASMQQANIPIGNGQASGIKYSDDSQAPLFGAVPN
jgi:hypothetical protein